MRMWHDSFIQRKAPILATLILVCIRMHPKTSITNVDIPICAVVSCPGSVATMAGCERSDTGEGGMIIVSGQLWEVVVLLLPSAPSNRWYFVSRTPASWFAPTLRLLRASVRVFHEVLTPDFSQVLSISRSWSMGSENWALILSSVPVVTLSRSPSRYQCAHMSRTSCSTWSRSSVVNLGPEKEITVST